MSVRMRISSAPLASDAESIACWIVACVQAASLPTR